jgi:hypothetical protein
MSRTGALRMQPFVLVPRPDLLPVVLAGAERAGRGPRVTILEEPLAPAAAVDRAKDSEMAVLSFDHAGARSLATHLADQGARLIPLLRAAPRVGVEPRCAAWLLALPPGLNVAVPSIDDDDERRLLWASLQTTGVAERHHLVDVDGRPALDELASRDGRMEGALLELLAAGAAGVLAGRMVVANRRWQDGIRG